MSQGKTNLASEFSEFEVETGTGPGHASREFICDLSSVVLGYRYHAICPFTRFTPSHVCFLSRKKASTWVRRLYIRAASVLILRGSDSSSWIHQLTLRLRLDFITVPHSRHSLPAPITRAVYPRVSKRKINSAFIFMWPSYSENASRTDFVSQLGVDNTFICHLGFVFSWHS